MTPDPTDFLYPFIDANEDDSAPLLSSLKRSAEEKANASFALKNITLEHEKDHIIEVAVLMANRFRDGGRLFAFGNGGSSTDAATLARLFSIPPYGTPLPARHLVSDYAVLSAISNDIGYDVVFSRQLIAHGTSLDIAVGFSTSGNSVNLLAAFKQASDTGMATLGFAGYDGGQMGTSPFVHHCLTVRSDSVHRIQEVQAALAFALWQQIQRVMREKVAQ